MIYLPESEGYREILPGIFLKTLAYGDSTQLCHFKLKKGALIPEHQHPEEQSGYLLSGKLRLFGEAGEKIVNPGSSWSFKGDVRHGAEALSECELVEVFSPVRPQYLPQKE